MTREVRAVTFVSPRSIELRTRSLPVCGTEQVRVSSLYSGISAGTEMNVFRGSAPQWRAKRDPRNGLFVPSEDPQWSYPLEYGYATVGMVEEVGNAVPSESALKVGSLVFTYTPHVSANIVPWRNVQVLRELKDPRAGVLVASLNTALNGLLDAGPVFGDVVVVSGLGVIGLLLVQLLKRSGVGLVVGVDQVSARRATAARLGAQLVFAPGESVAEEVRRQTSNRGADIVIEVSGASQALNEAVRIAGFNGRVIAMSWYGGTFESLSLSGEFHHNRIRIVSSQVGAINPELGPLWTLQRRQDLVLSLLNELDLASLITHTIPVAEAARAYALVDEGDEDLIQCVLSYI